VRIRFLATAVVLVLVIVAVATGMISRQAFGTWVAALLTISIFTFLYKDNPVYKLAEHVFIGVSAGYFVALEYWNVFRPNLWDPLVAGLRETSMQEVFSVGSVGVSLPVFPDMSLLVPFALGVLLFTRFHPRIGWLSRWSMAAMIGSYAGLAIIGALQGDLVAQIRANMIPLLDPGSLEALVSGSAGGILFGVLEVLRNPLIILGLLTTLVYFFFSREHRGSLGAASRVGVWFLMISFGASFGYTVMSRVSLLIGRLHFLMSDWLGIIR
jgi:hypothetical protein